MTDSKDKKLTILKESSSSSIVATLSSLKTPFTKEIIIKGIEAKNLPPKLAYFCTVTLCDSNDKRFGKEKTSVIKSQNPVWPEIMKFPSPANAGNVTLHVLSKQKVGSKDVGHVIVAFEESFLKSEKNIESTYDLYPSKGKPIKFNHTSPKLTFMASFGEKKGDTTGGDKVVTLTNSTNRAKKRQELQKTSYVAIMTSKIDPTSKDAVPREGPRATELVPFANSSLFITNEEVLEVENDCTTDTIQICTGNVKVRTNKWYFETVIERISDEAKVYIGWTSDKFTAWGDKTGWFWSNHGKKCGTSSEDASGGNVEKWSSSNVIGCALDLFKGRIIFTRNGKIQFKYSDIKRGSRCGDHFIPTFAFEKVAKISANFGHKPFQYFPDSYFPLHFQLGTDDRVKLETVFDKYTVKNEPQTGDSDTSDSSNEWNTTDSSSSSSQSTSEDDQQQDNPENVILPTFKGCLQYYSDLDIDFGTDMMSVLVVSWKLNVKKAFTFNREEFIIGWSVAGCKDLNQMKEKIKEWKKQAETDQFELFYHFCGKFLMNKKKHSILAVDAVVIWKLLFRSKSWALWDDWIQFVQKDCEAVTAEVWDSLPSFMEKFTTKFDGFDPDKWPKLFSTFKEKKQ